MISSPERETAEGKSAEPEAQTAEIVPVETVPTRNAIVFLYHELDQAVFSELYIHIEALMARLGSAFTWKCYLYPTYLTKEGAHEAFVKDLGQAIIFMPCTSAQFLTRFWAAMKGDRRIKSLLESTVVQPIPFRLAHGVSQSLLEHPLTAYDQGHSRDVACSQVVSFIERTLLEQMSQDQALVPLPLLLAETVNR